MPTNLAKLISVSAASNLNEDHHFMMFSATFNKDSRELARKYLEDDHIRIRVGRTGSVHGNIAQDVSLPHKELVKASY